MTIVLPYPTPQGANLADNDAGNGVPAAPRGAPEFMDPDTYNDVDRYDKTAIKQNTENTLAINNAIGTMAEQDASAVAITGGTITGTTIDEAVNAQQLGGLTLQQIYDALLPVGFVQMRSAFSLPVAPAGVTATWELLPDSDGRVLRMTEASPPLTVGGSDTRTTAAGTGNTGDTALTEAQLAAHRHQLFAANSVAGGSFPESDESAAVALTGGGDQEYSIIASSPTTLEPVRARSSEAGTGATHNHPAGDHTHQVTVLPRYMELAAYVRTA